MVARSLASISVPRRLSSNHCSTLVCRETPLDVTCVHSPGGAEGTVTFARNAEGALWMRGLLGEEGSSRAGGGCSVPRARRPPPAPDPSRWVARDRRWVRPPAHRSRPRRARDRPRRRTRCTDRRRPPRSVARDPPRVRRRRRRPPRRRRGRRPQSWRASPRRWDARARRERLLVRLIVHVIHCVDAGRLTRRLIHPHGPVEVARARVGGRLFLRVCPVAAQKRQTLGVLHVHPIRNTRLEPARASIPKKTRGRSRNATQRARASTVAAADARAWRGIRQLFNSSTRRNRGTNETAPPRPQASSGGTQF